MKKIFLFLLLLPLLVCNTFASSQKTIGVYVQAPIADPECAEALRAVLSKKYNVIMLTHKTLTTKNLKQIDCLAFPGGLGDADVFDDLLIDKKRIVQQYIKNGGAYLGICMGAYYAGPYYFNILKEADPVQYIKRPKADVTREDQTISPILWNDQLYNMYFFDGCAIIGNNTQFKTVAKYANGDAMAIIQNKIGIIGCHPESFVEWYDHPELKPFWHQGTHHDLLLEFVNLLLK
jgi:hypothetical protein